MDNTPATQLLTLLNISAGKRKRSEDEFIPALKLNKRKSTKFQDAEPTAVPSATIEVEAAVEIEETLEAEGARVVYVFVTRLDLFAETSDTYESHFGISPSALSESSRGSVEKRAWKHSKQKIGRLGPVVVSTPDGEDSPSVSSSQIDVCVILVFFLSALNSYFIDSRTTKNAVQIAAIQTFPWFVVALEQ